MWPGAALDISGELYCGYCCTACDKDDCRVTTDSVFLRITVVFNFSYVLYKRDT